MEVTNVSPSPTSPTEGDDLCEIDVTNVALYSVALLIGLFGLAGNGAVFYLRFVYYCNFRIFLLAVADFFYLLFTVPTTVLFLLEEEFCSNILPFLYLWFLYFLPLLSYILAVFLLTRTRIWKYMDMFWELCCRRDPPMRLWWLLGRVQCGAAFALFIAIPMVRPLCPSHYHEHCRVALISMFTVILLLFAVPVVISSTIAFNANWGSQQQQTKRRDIITIIVILFTLLLSICSFLLQFSNIIVSTQVYFLLTCITSTIKPYMYFLAKRYSRSSSVLSLQLSLQRVPEEQTENTANSNDTNTDTLACV